MANKAALAVLLGPALGGAIMAGSLPLSSDGPRHWPARAPGDLVLVRGAQAQAAPAALLGAWCSEGVSLILSPSQIQFVLPDNLRVSYTIDDYRSAGGSVLVYWTDDQERRIVTEFGNFSPDRSEVEQIRGRLEPDGEWFYNNREFARC